LLGDVRLLWEIARDEITASIHRLKRTHGKAVELGNDTLARAASLWLAQLEHIKGRIDSILSHIDSTYYVHESEACELLSLLDKLLFNIDLSHEKFLTEPLRRPLLLAKHAASSHCYSARENGVNITL